MKNRIKLAFSSVIVLLILNSQPTGAWINGGLTAQKPAQDTAPPQVIFHFSTLATVSPTKVLAGPPAADSKKLKKDFDTLLKWQANRTSKQIEQAQYEDKTFTAYLFANVLGPQFTAEQLPMTDEFLKKVLHDAGDIAEAAKGIWKRPRPYHTDSRIEPCVTRSKSFSYPSGSATLGRMWALVLADIFPKQRKALLKRGQEIGLNRVIGGAHFPSDVEAGAKLADAMYRQLKKDPEYKKGLMAVKTEVSQKSPLSR